MYIFDKKMRYQTLLTDLSDHVFTITINRSEKLNALNGEVMSELNLAIDEVYNNPEIKSAIITGAGPRAFIAGADITEFNGLTKEQARSLSKKGQDIFFKIENAPKPIVAAVNGFALGGGCELALSCHFRLCSSQAKFGQPEINLGLIPGYGGTQRLTMIAGRGRALEYMMTGTMISAEEALSMGIVNHLTSPEELLPKCREILQTIGTKAPIAVSRIIDSVNAFVSNGKEGFEKELDNFAFCFNTEDMIEGVAAFIEKRKAQFKGK